MALIRTDYGLIYNTDGSLCATLLPEGGVAVTEATENLITICGGAALYDEATWLNEDVEVVYDPTCPVGNGYVAKLDATTNPTYEDLGYVQILPEQGIAAGNKYTLSWWFKGNNEPDYDSRLYYTDGTYYSFRGNLIWKSNPTPDPNKWQYYEAEFEIPDEGKTITKWYVPRFYFGSSDDTSIGYFSPFMLEAGFATPFVDGTRPAGSLSYDLPISINGDWTIAKWLELEPYFMDKTSSGDNPIGKYRLPLLELGEKYYTEGYGVIGVYGAWEPNRPGNTINIMANKDTDRVYSSMPDTIRLTEAEYNNKILAVLTKSGSMLTAYIYTVGNKYVLTCNIASLGDISQITPRLNYHTVTTSNRRMYSKRHLNTLVCPYAVSPETVATWHSLDAPFYDPREQIDAAARPIYAPGVVIDETGAWGISNGVKQAGFGTDGRWVAGGGSVVADETGLKIISPNGDYSLMDANQLRFFKTGYDVPYWYAKRVTYGIAEDGDYIDLASETGVPWDQAPKVITAINSLISYNPASSHAEQHFEAYVDGVTNEGFYVYCKNVIPATWSDWNDQNITLQPSYTTDYTPTSVTDLEISINSGRIGTWLEYPPVWVLYQHYITIAYQKLGGSWVTYFQGYPGGSANQNYADKNYTYHISGLEPGQYRVAVSGQTGSGVVNYAKLNGWRYRNVSTVNTGRVMWIAIEGGSI